MHPLNFYSTFIFFFIASFFILTSCEDDFEIPVVVDPIIPSVICEKKYGEAPYLDSTCYYGNQILTNTDGFSDTEKANLEGFLVQNGFSILKNCECESDLRLWQHDSLSAVPNLIGVVEGAKTKGTGIGNGDGVSLHFRFSLPNTFPIIEAANPGITPDIQPPGNSILVGAVDGGISTHQNLQDNFRSGIGSFCQATGDHQFGIDIVHRATRLEPVDHNGHGTFVNGIVAGSAFPDPGSSDGIRIELLNAKVTPDSARTIDLFDALCGSYYLIEQGVSVLNNSWGFIHHDIPTVFIPFIQKAYDNQVVITAGIGNNSLLLEGDQYFWPAAFSQNLESSFGVQTPGSKIIIAVGAYDISAQQLPNFTNWGPLVDLYAPGTEIISLAHTNPDEYSQASGTSMSTAYVSRTVATIMGRPGAKFDEVKPCLLFSANQMPSGVSGQFEAIPLLNHASAIQSPCY